MRGEMGRGVGLVGLLALMVGCAGDGTPPLEPEADRGGPRSDGGMEIGVDDGSPLAPRVENRTCRLPPAPPIGNMRVVPAFPRLALQRALWFGVAPGEPDLRFAIEQSGRVVWFDPAAPGDVQTFYQRPVSRNHNEEGLLGLAFHPDYAQNGRFFIYYSAANPRRSVISEVQRDPMDPLRARPESEQILLEVEQPFGNHNGGDLHFGPDGYLYISLGDGGAAGDPLGHGQDTSSLLGSILRIDVDRADAACGLPYGIPPDNPFAAERCQPGDPGAGRPEIWAWGLRNVWRMSFDRSTGELWAADVGQDRLEEVNRVEGGHNYGWNPVEGDECYVPGCDRDAFTPPVFAYGHDEGKSITGGFVYRGAALPELWGAYVFGDYNSGRIWALRPSPGGPPEVTVLADSGRQITSFGEDADGELYVVTFDAGINRLERAAAPVDVEPLPEWLSETGCFDDTATHTLAPGVVPYGVNARLWSDGAIKLRSMALPAGTQMIWRDEGVFEVPVGTVLIKTFLMAQPDGTERRVETRMIRKGEDRWNGYSFRWNEEQTDARLLAGSESRTLETAEGPLEWVYPSRAQCDQCHIQSQGYALGLSGPQLNRMFDYDGQVAAQLDALAEAGYVTPPGPAAGLPAFPDIEDADAPISDRARAYLEANCASCHQPDGPANADIDLRASTPFAEMGLCDAEPQQGDLGIDGAVLLAPGDPARSLMFARMNLRGEGQMPQLATNRIDPWGTNLVGAWIQMQPGCP